jgi:putative oxidoreductase
MKKELLIDIIVTLIIMMFLYASFSKYFDFSSFKRAIHNQPFPYWFSSLLIIFIPPIEITIAFLLFREKTRKKGLLASVILMSLFTFYIGAILLHFFPSVPCSCGGIIRMLSWQQHLFFNLFFIIISGIGLSIQSKPTFNKLKQSNKLAFGHKDISRAKSG